jgi:translation elongation factor EF-Ts
MPSYDRRDPEKAYEQVTGDIRKAMRSLEEKLRVHAGKQRDKSNDWGYVGDVTEVLKRLQEVNDFMGSTK